MSINFSKPQDIHIIYSLYVVTHVGKGLKHLLSEYMAYWYSLNLDFFGDTLYIIDTMIILGSNRCYLANWSTLNLFVLLKHINIWYFIFHVSVFVIIVVYLVPLGAYRHEFVLVRLMITTELQLFISRYFLYMVAINIYTNMDIFNNGLH